jgi:hypothetical protein
MDKLLQKYIDKYNDPRKAFRHLCLKWDMYYSDDLYDQIYGEKGVKYLIGTYFSRINGSQWGGGSKTFDNTLDEENGDSVNSIEELQEAKENGNLKVTQKSIKLWGFGFSPEDYEYLESTYGDWKAKVIIDGKARDTLVRELCVIKLQQNKALQSNNIDLYEKLTKLYQKTLESANLKPLQEDAAEKSGEKPLGVMIQMFENERPVPKPDPEWEDVDGIVRFITIYFLGHLSKMLNLKNKYAKMYEDEMDKYRVEIPEFSEADDDDIFDYITNGGDNDEPAE